MNKFAKIASSALLLAGSAMGAAIVTSAPASAAHVSVGINVGAPVYGPRGYYVAPENRALCRDPYYAAHHPGNCGPGGYTYYGPQYYGYYDSGYYGSGYYEPVVNGFWFVDTYGHRRFHRGRFEGHGFHGRGEWRRDWHHDRRHDRH